jgi:ABC-type amino acid transport substrate-binding protein
MMRSVLIGILISVSSSAFADKFTFCYEPWAPYAESTGATTGTGASIEFIDSVMKALGHTVDFKTIGSPERCAAEVSAGKLDAMMFASAGQVKGGVESATVTEYWLIAAIVNESNPLTKFSSLADFSGKTVGVVKGYLYPDELNGFKGMKKDEVVEADANLRKLDAGRIDVSFDDPIWTMIEAKKNKYKLKALSPLLAADPNYLEFNGKHKELAKKYDAKAAELIKSGLLDKLYKQHVGMTMTEVKSKFGVK